MPRIGSAFLLSWVNRFVWLSKRLGRPASRCRLWAAVSLASRFPHLGVWCPQVLRSWSDSLADLPLHCHTWDEKPRATVNGAQKRVSARCCSKAVNSSCVLACDAVSPCQQCPALWLVAAISFSRLGGIMWNCVSARNQPSDGPKRSRLLLPVSPAN